MSNTVIVPPDSAALASSKAYCQQLTRAKARNFYYGLKLLPQPKRGAMFALYAYMRLLDDIADGEEGESTSQRLANLDRWSEQTRAALDGHLQANDHPIWPAFADMAARYHVPGHIFEDVIAGQRQDLHVINLANFDELKQYCYRVAGVVGLASIYVWGFEGGAATENLAVDRGIAFQLTNILRDLREDAGRGRSYIPRDELDSLGLTLQDISQGKKGKSVKGFDEFLKNQIRRAEYYYQRSAALEQFISRDARPTLVAMTQIYHGLLQKIAARPLRVLSERVSLSTLHKLRIAWRAARAK